MTYGIAKIDEGFQRARIGALEGALRRAAQALQDVHAKSGYVGINDEAVVALANANSWSGKTWQQALARQGAPWTGSAYDGLLAEAKCAYRAGLAKSGTLRRARKGETSNPTTRQP